MGTLELQREFFQSGATRPVAWRARQLGTLYQVIQAYEPEILQALQLDLGKGAFESYETEIGMVLHEIHRTIRCLRRWSRPVRRSAPFTQFLSGGRIYPEPYGVCLILAPWNYPFQLSLLPLVSSMAAGNCSILKPSELAPHVSQMLSELINNNFEERFCSVVQGGQNISETLLQQKFDLIFFTGSTRVGTIVMKNAAKQLTPVILELGGKSPVIVDGSSDLSVAARRIAWGKFLNAGQTCVAPDYLLVQERAREQLLFHLKKAVTDFYGPNPLMSPDLQRVVNRGHFDRLCALLDCGEVVLGGDYSGDTLKISPTLIADPDPDSPLMQEEIFGPILPVLSYRTLDEAIQFIASRPRPLALYLFSNDHAVRRRVLSSLNFGGGCINDTISHLAVHSLPFGGVGDSGMGVYHGKAGFDAFSHPKSVLTKWDGFDLKLRYPPYRERALGIIRTFLR